MVLNDVEREDFVIKLHQLWITSGPDPNDPQSVYLVKRDTNGCVIYHPTVGKDETSLTFTPKLEMKDFN